MKEETFHSERKKIQQQFIFFTFAYITRATIDFTCYFLLVSKNDYNYARNMIYLCTIIPVAVVPIMHVLWVHVKIYTRCATQKQSMDSSFESVATINQVMVRLSDFD